MSTKPSISVRENVVSVLNVSTHYWEYGNPDANTTIIMIHGFRGDHHGLEQLASELHEYRIISPDLPGFGLSQPFTLTHDINTYIQWLNAFITKVKCKNKPVVLGHSFGTLLVAAATASGLPTKSIILLNPLVSPLSRLNPGAQLTVLYYWLVAVLPEQYGLQLLKSKLLVRLMSLIMVKTKNKQLRQWIHHQHDQYFAQISQIRVILDTFDIMKKTGISQFADNISNTCLLIGAEKDNIGSLVEQKKLTSLYSNFELDIVPDCGHLLHYEAPGIVAKKIRLFLTGDERDD